jgi:hypothetical protein
MWYISFFPPELQMWWLRPLWCYGEYTYDCKLKKIREMLLPTLEHNQHDVIDDIWRLLIIFVYCCKYDM